MIITHYGAFCFKVQSGDKVLAFDPPSKESKLKAPRFKADIVFVSGDDKDRNGFENISSKEEKELFLVNGPGEYEIAGLHGRGIRASHLNSIYMFKLEDINVCHFGNLEVKDFDMKILEHLVDIDILFVPTKDGIKKIINQLQPKIVIPMNYGKKELDSFLSELGSKAKPIDKFSFKKKDIIDKKEEVVILKF